jgi:hypothetical protein
MKKWGVWATPSRINDEPKAKARWSGKARRLEFDTESHAEDWAELRREQNPFWIYEVRHITEP